MFRSYPGRLAGLYRQAQRVAAITAGLLASAAAIPAAFAQERPAGLHRHATVTLISQAAGHPAAGAAGPTGWQIALIGIGVPLALTGIGVVLRRVRAARRAAPPSTT